MKKHLFIFLLSLSGFLPSPSIADTWSDWIPNFKKSVVNIEAHVEVSLGRNESGIFYGTGFIVDAERGLVVTNQHIAGSSPISFLKISFNNGAAVEGRMIYFDPWHDFAFVQFDPRRLSFIPQAVRLGSHQQLKENEELMLIGNNELESYSIKRGRVTKLFVNKGFNDPARHSHYIHSDFDRTGGSSGSPVWNKKGEVIGIHAGGTDTSSFELRIDYVVDALKKIQQDKIPERGDLQISLETLSLTNAKDYFSYVPTPTLQTAKAGVDPQYILQVKDVLLGSPASQLLKIGDIVVAIEGKTIGADLYEFDRLVDEKFANNKTAAEVNLTVFRNQKFVQVKLPVMDGENGKLSRYVLFAGATFHDVTTDVGLYYNITCDGVFVSESSSGGSFVDVFKPVSQERRYKRMAVIHEINGQKIRDLDDFIKIVGKIKNGSKVNILANDLYDLGTARAMMIVDIQDLISPFRSFRWQADRAVWEPEPNR